MPILQNYETLAACASKLRLLSKGIADGMKTGSLKSMYRGHGIEFSGVREYFRGDDVRSIDWNVTARMGRPYVQLFDEERELILFFVIDRSLSMYTGSSEKTRLSIATEAAALLTFAAEQSSSPIGAVFFDGETSFSCEPKSGKDQAMLIISRLDDVPEKTVTGSVLTKAIRGTARMLKRRSLVFIFSDFRTTGYESELARLATKHDVVAMCITDKTDSELPEAGAIPFYDIESENKITLPTAASSFRRAWRDACDQRLERWKSVCLRRGVIPVTMSTEDDPVQVLSRFFSERNKV